MIEIELDGKKVSVPPGSMVMHAADAADTYIPHFCYHKKLSIAANCRMCLVDIEKAPKPMPACATPVTQGMIVRTKSDKAIKAQQSVMEFLLINHPLDCPICDQGGECQLQDLAVGYGASKSRYTEEKRVVFHKNVGPLISMEEMSRCIHCTRCVRFGQEIAGQMELGMAHRGEHAEIVAFVDKTVDSELSGNMIDICPVGALTSKPFRFKARPWELTRRRSVSPHDGHGSNLIVQVKQDRVMRVLPFENEAINECWISDKDRFSYEALYTEERLTRPMVKQGGEWKEVDWQAALEVVARGLAEIAAKYGPGAIAAAVSAHATLEEQALTGALMRALGSDNVDFRLRQTDFRYDDARAGIPWLGMPIADLGALDRVLVIGSFLRKDHPLIAQRLRQAVKKGARVAMLHSVDDDWRMPVAHRAIVTPSLMPMMLAEIVVAAAQGAGKPPPKALEGIDPTAAAEVIAASLLGGTRRAIFLGNYATQHGEASQLAALAQALSEIVGGTLGVLTESANTVGAYVARAHPQAGGMDAQAMFNDPRRAYLLLNVEPEFDCAKPAAARAALEKAELTVVLSPFKLGTPYADVLLPIAPFTETAGTFVNCEGRAQTFRSVATPLGETRPAWKVLRVLGTMLELDGFAFDTIEDVRARFLPASDGIAARLSNATQVPIEKPVAIVTGIERVADVPIHFADPLVRRSPPLQRTADARAPRARVHRSLAETLAVEDGGQVRIRQGRGEAVLGVAIDPAVPPGIVRVAAGHPSTCGLDGLSGPVTVERA